MSRHSLPEEEGEGYFASISDLMVGVLFVFLMMMVVLALNFRDDDQQLVATRLQMEAARTEAERSKAEADRLRVQNAIILKKLALAAQTLRERLAERERQRDTLLQKLAEGLTKAQVRFEIDYQTGVLHLSDAIPFDTGRSDLTQDEAKHTVKILADVLGNILPCFTASGSVCAESRENVLETVLVEGHTDTQQYSGMTPLQSEAENDRLSTARALTVFAALRSEAPSLDLLRNQTAQPLLGVSGYGQRRPLPGTDQDTPDDLSRNRRIDLRFVIATPTSTEVGQLLREIDALMPRTPP